MIQFLPFAVKVFAGLVTAKVAKDAVVYATTDQEKEGREKGIEATAKIYEPILKNLEERQKKIIAATDKEQSFLGGQAKSLKEQCAKYEKKTAELAVKI